MNTFYFACAKYIYLGKNIWAKCQDSPTSYIWVKKSVGHIKENWPLLVGQEFWDTCYLTHRPRS